MNADMMLKHNINALFRPLQLRRITRGLAVMIASATLLACSGGGGADTETNPVPPTSPEIAQYNGPLPRNADVKRFMDYFWANTARADRCGSCHHQTGQEPRFVRNDDINLAYDAAYPLAVLTDPARSRFVEKVGSGHNCWLSSNSACADTMTSYIRNWAGGVSGGQTEVQLVPPVIKDPGSSRIFPADSSLFATHVYTPYLRPNCAGCHAEDADKPQQPYFASANVDVAYAAVRDAFKIDLDHPDQSRVVVRLREESHNCWTSNCLADANEMQEGVEAFAAAVPPVVIDPSLVYSKALRMVDGIIASGGGRFEQNTIALWQFKEGSGVTAFDTSGIEPAVNLNLRGDVTWVGGWGLQIKGDSTNPGRAQASTVASKKLSDQIRSTAEYTIEAWVAPANVTQDDARIVSYSGGTDVRNFSLTQSMYNYDFWQRTSTSNANGQPMLSTADADERAQAALQHVVLTYSPLVGRKIYVNGEFTGDIDPVPPGNFNDWDDTFAFILGNEVSGDRQWQGILKLVAIHNRALTEAQVKQNFKVGVGERFYLLFSVASHVSDPGCRDNNQIPQCYIVFEVSRYDNYSYLFNTPFFVSLNPAVDLSAVPVQKMRIGINGREASVGQAYRNLDTFLGGNTAETRNKHVLSPLGTIVALNAGPATDEFFLTFEKLGNDTHVVLEPEPPQAPPAQDLPPASDIGVRTFDAINASMASITGVSRNDANVVQTYGNIRQSLPATADIQSFLSSHQMAITQLAIEYCNALIESPALRSAFFPGFDFSAPVSTAFNSSGRQLVLDALLSKMVGNNLQSQPTDSEVRTELDNLITRLSTCGASCPADRTRTIVKASCAAGLGNAAMLVQ